jgi:hypothetical protein
LLFVEEWPESIAAIKSYLSRQGMQWILEQLEENLTAAGLGADDIKKGLSLIQDFDSELKNNTSESQYSFVHSEIQTTFNNMNAILKDSILTDPKQKIEKVKALIDRFIEKMSPHEKPALSKKAAVFACRLMGALAGLLLTPFVPFAMLVVLPSIYLERTANPSNPSGTDNAKAIGWGLLGSLLSIIASPLIAMAYVSHLVENDFIKQRFASAEEATAAIKKMRNLFQLFTKKDNAVEAGLGLDPEEKQHFSPKGGQQ